MPLKSSYKSNSTRNLYEFAEEFILPDTPAEKGRLARESTDKAAAMHAIDQGRDKT
jgi:hypothetical protein